MIPLCIPMSSKLWLNSLSVLLRQRAVVWVITPSLTPWSFWFWHLFWLEDERFPRLNKYNVAILLIVVYCKTIVFSLILLQMLIFCVGGWHMAISIASTIFFFFFLTLFPKTTKQHLLHMNYKFLICITRSNSGYLVCTWSPRWISKTLRLTLKQKHC